MLMREVSRALEELSANRYIVTGAAGSGKSEAMKFLLEPLLGVSPRLWADMGVADAKEVTISRIVKTVEETVRQSGFIATAKRKNKELLMSSSELATYIADLMDAQNNLCKLTGLRMLLDKEDGDEALRCSLDRIDSDKHYEKGNLHLVCQFINFWKNDTPNQDFIRLLQLVRSTSP